MPIWAIVVVSCCSTVAFIIFVNIVLMLLGGRSIRDNIIFKNKYLRKIYCLKEESKRKIEKIKEKVNDQIAKLEYKSIYCENMKILHEKNLNSTILLSSKDFIKNSKKKGK